MRISLCTRATMWYLLDFCCVPFLFVFQLKYWNGAVKVFFLGGGEPSEEGIPLCERWPFQRRYAGIYLVMLFACMLERFAVSWWLGQVSPLGLALMLAFWTTTAPTNNRPTTYKQHTINHNWHNEFYRRCCLHSEYALGHRPWFVVESMLYGFKTWLRLKDDAYW